jgi:NADPH-dependent ferric siderophore reductase
MNILNIFQRDRGPEVERVRHIPKIRSLQVDSVQRLSPGMLRITFSGDDLADFRSLGFDDHVKLFVPSAFGDIQRRDYTPRRFDTTSCTLVLDFAIHDAGPATQWALNAKPGDTIQIAGPKGSSFVSSDIRRWLLIGDETALPAMGRRIEEADAASYLTSIAAVAGPDEEQVFDTRAQVSTLWAHRLLSAAADPAALLAMVQSFDLSRDTFVWIAAEARVARAIRDHIVNDRGHPRSWVKAGGYWIMGRADAHERIG